MANRPPRWSVYDPETKPHRYYIGYENSELWDKEIADHSGDQDAVDPINVWVEDDGYNTLAPTVKLAKKRSRENRDTSVVVYERRDMFYTHPYDDHPVFGYWDWVSVPVGQYNAGEYEKYD